MRMRSQVRRDKRQSLKGEINLRWNDDAKKVTEGLGWKNKDCRESNGTKEKETHGQKHKFLFTHVLSINNSLGPLFSFVRLLLVIPLPLDLHRYLCASSIPGIERRVNVLWAETGNGLALGLDQMLYWGERNTKRASVPFFLCFEETLRGMKRREATIVRMGADCCLSSSSSRLTVFGPKDRT